MYSTLYITLYNIILYKLNYIIYLFGHEISAKQLTLCFKLEGLARLKPLYREGNNTMKIKVKIKYNQVHIITNIFFYKLY